MNEVIILADFKVNALYIALAHLTSSDIQCPWQVCAYRCITSYETQSMEKFSLCVLQKNNCMRKSAEIPALPDPAPLARFRGKDVTHDVAQDIFVGWLGQERFSWKVVRNYSRKTFDIHRC